MAKSKVQQAKENQGYTKDAPKCQNCKHFSSELVKEPTYWQKSRVVEKNKRCGLGGFAVQVSAWCELHSFDD